jgi:prephenate dehydrogenase
VTILEGVVGIGLIGIAATALLSATLASSRIVNVPPSRDHVLVAAHNAAVEARALASYDASAAAAILAAPSAEWSTNGIALRSSVTGQTLVIVASSGAQSASIRYGVAREALPQGAIVDTSGNVIVP